MTTGGIALVLLLWLVWWQSEAIDGWFRGARPDVAEQAAGANPAGPGTADPVAASGSTGDAGTISPAAQRWTALMGQPPVWPDDLTSPASCETVEEEFQRVCAGLQTALRTDEPATENLCATLLEAVERLASRPPDASSELKSHAALLGNVFHLVRVLGRKRVEGLRQMMDRSAELAEPAAMTFYRRLVSLPYCDGSDSTRVRTEPLYDYATYLFTTMGGQAYLRRRSPRVESLTSFYALLVVDRALAANHNPHGLDPRAEIRRTRELLQGQSLLFGDEYVAVLDEMAHRWSARGDQRPAAGR